MRSETKTNPVISTRKLLKKIVLFQEKSYKQI